MTGEEIRQMFLVTAAVRHMPDCDPRKEQASDMLARMTRRYMAENFAEANGEKVEQAAPDWMSSLEYVRALFQDMDKNEQEPDHAVMCAKRRAVWETIANGVSNWYCKREQSGDQN